MERGELRGSRPVAGDLWVTRRGEGGVRLGEDEAQDDEERHDPNAEEDYGGAVVLAEETRDSHAALEQCCVRDLYVVIEMVY